MKAATKKLMEKTVMTVDADVEPPVILQVDPQHLVHHEVIKGLRAWTGKTRQEEEIESLAQSILEEGQMQPGVAWETDDGLVLVIGERRATAVQRLREAGHDVMFRVIIDPTIHDLEDAVKKALKENEDREDFTPIEMARNIGVIRKMLSGGSGAKKEVGTAMVAKFMGKDPATITQMERLLTLPEEVQRDVEAGVMKWNTALELTASPAEKRVEVVKKAKEVAEKRASEKGKGKTDGKVEKSAKTEKPKSGNGDAEKKKKEAADGDVQLPVGVSGDTTGDKQADEPSVRVTSRDIREAQRRVEGGLEKLRAPKIQEAIDGFADFLNGYSPEMQAFAKSFIDWATAKKEWKSVEGAWEDLEDALVAARKPSEKSLESKKPERVVSIAGKTAGKAAKKIPEPLKAAAKKSGVGGKGKTAVKKPVKKPAEKSKSKSNLKAKTKPKKK